VEVDLNLVTEDVDIPEKSENEYSSLLSGENDPDLFILSGSCESDGTSVSSLDDLSDSDSREVLVNRVRQYIIPSTAGNVLLAILHPHRSIYSCLPSDLCKHYATYARHCSVKFVQLAFKIYGQDVLVYNMHSVIHIADDVELFGPLDNSSCFPFENYLRYMNKLICRPSMPVHLYAYS